MKVLIKVIAAFAAVFFIIFFYISANILAFGNISKPRMSDVIIVLGCQVWGRSPSWSLEYRLEKALELYKEGYAEYIIVSGGQGKDEEITEARAMKEWLVNHGVDGKKIFEEGSSTSTYENLKFSKEIMDRQGFKTAVIVSNDFHIYRSLSLAKKLGIKATGAPSRTVAHLKLYYHIREVLSVVKSFIADR